MQHTPVRSRRTARAARRPRYALWAAAGTLAVLLLSTRWPGFAPSDPQSATIGVEGQT